MRSKFFLAIALFAFESCKSPVMNFNSMSYEEIDTYNQTVGMWEQVFCDEETSVRSRIPRRRCATLFELQQEVIGNVGLMNSATSGKSALIIN